jgi:lipoprotein-anchoring transpeptidase ErfK/SrfK
VVFDMSDQRVWLVRTDGSVLRTYLVSGSKADNLDAGRYEVYSRSRHATGYTGTTTMDYMVRFTTGDEAAIGFHDIPEDAQGRPVQGHDELGTATSAGCVRQRTADARKMWAFAPEGTRVVVVD